MEESWQSTPEEGEGSKIDGISDVRRIHGKFGVILIILVHMVPAGRTVKEAFAWKTISRSRGDQIRYSNCVVQRSVWKMGETPPKVH